MTHMPLEVAGNLFILGAVLLGPFLLGALERNLEAFLLVMGIGSALVSSVLSPHLVADALRSPLPITAAVAVSGGLFAAGRRQVARVVEALAARWELPR